MTLVGIVRKNNRFLPSNMQPAKERSVYSTNFTYNHEPTVRSYVPKKNKSVVLLSSMHMTVEVEETIVPSQVSSNTTTKLKAELTLLIKC